MAAAEDLRIKEDGAQLFARAAVPALDNLAEVLAPYDTGMAGSRIACDHSLRHVLINTAAVGAIPLSLLGPKAQPVRAILFDKSAESNWTLGWHQDRTICVSQRVDVPGFGPWTRKHGLLHVQPPFAVIERMITLRIHLDPVGESNAPLLIARGSHRLGQLHERDVAAVVADSPLIACVAKAGDVWAYSTPILHASERNHSASRRRVLQVDYSAEQLPDGLCWLGV